MTNKDCDEFITKLEKSLKNDLLEITSVNTITDLSECVNISIGYSIIPIFGTFGAILSTTMCSKNAQKAIIISNKLKNINEYKQIRDHFEFGNKLPKDHYINKKDNKELYYKYKKFCTRSNFGIINDISSMTEFKEYIEKN